MRGFGEAEGSGVGSPSLARGTDARQRTLLSVRAHGFKTLREMGFHSLQPP